MSRQVPIESQTRILLVRTSALGDIAHALPVLRALRRERPEARIAWVVEDAFAPLLEGHPDLDLVVTVRLREWRDRLTEGRTRRGISGSLRQLRAFRPTVALDLMGNHKAALLALLSGARYRVGLGRRWRREPSSALWLNRTVPALGPHAVERAMSVLAALGLEHESVDFGGDRLCAAGEDPDPGSAGRRLVLLPGAGWGNKRYPEVLWARAGRLLRERVGEPVIAVTGPGEEALGETIEIAADGAVRHLPVPGLPPLVALLRSSRLVLGGDTGPMHLAHALGTPVVAVMGPTDPRRHGPWGDSDAAVVDELPCSYCYRRLDGPRPCLMNVRPERVLEAALGQLGQSPAASIDPG